MARRGTSTRSDGAPSRRSWIPKASNQLRLLPLDMLNSVFGGLLTMEFTGQQGFIELLCDGFCFLAMATGGFLS